MPIPVTPRFKRLLETANPEQKKALGTSSVQSDSDSRDYREEKFKSMPRAMKRIDAGYQDTTDMTPAEKEKYAFENTLSDFRARFRNDEQATHVLDLLEKQYYNSMLAPDKKPYSYYYDNPEDTRRVGVIQPVAQPVPDPFDEGANALEGIMGPSDIIPDAVYNLTGSKLLEVASNLFSPTSAIKSGTKGISKIIQNQAKKEPPIVRYKKEAEVIQRNMGVIPEGFTRLWRGNRPGEVGKNPSFTNSLDGIALPFKDAYGGPLSFVDIPTEDLGKYLNRGVTAEGSEFILPEFLAKKAKEIK